MKVIRINTPDGKIIKLNAPDDATPEMIQQKAIQAKDVYLSQNAPAAPQKQKGSGIMERIQDSLGPIGLVGKAQDVIQGGFDRMGSKVAESLAGQGIQMAPGTGAKPLAVSPEMAAGAGTAVQMTPDIVQSMLPEGSVAGVTKSLKPGPSKAKVLSQTAESIQKELETLAVKAKAFPNEHNASRIKALEARLNAGKAIQEWESKIPDYKFGGQPEITESTKGLIKQIADMEPKRLAQKFDLKKLQEFYDKAKGMGNKGLDSSLVTRAKQKITAAQDIFSPGIIELRENANSAYKAVDGLKDQFKTGKSTLAEMTKRKQIALADVKERLKKATTGKRFMKKVGWKALEAAGLGGAISLLK